MSAPSQATTAAPAAALTSTPSTATLAPTSSGPPAVSGTAAEELNIASGIGSLPPGSSSSSSSSSVVSGVGLHSVDSAYGASFSNNSPSSLAVAPSASFSSASFGAMTSSTPHVTDSSPLIPQSAAQSYGTLHASRLSAAAGSATTIQSSGPSVHPAPLHSHHASLMSVSAATSSPTSSPRHARSPRSPRSSRHTLPIHARRMNRDPDAASPMSDGSNSEDEDEDEEEEEYGDADLVDDERQQWKKQFTKSYSRQRSNRSSRTSNSHAKIREQFKRIHSLTNPPTKASSPRSRHRHHRHRRHSKHSPKSNSASGSEDDKAAGKAGLATVITADMTMKMTKSPTLSINSNLSLPGSATSSSPLIASASHEDINQLAAHVPAASMLTESEKLALLNEADDGAADRSVASIASAGFDASSASMMSISSSQPFMDGSTSLAPRSSSFRKRRQPWWKRVTNIFTKRINYYVPIVGWLPHYSFRENFIGDLSAGISVGALLVPQGLAYASLANVPMIHGLYSAFFPLLMYFVMGSSPHLSIGPEVSSSILLGQSIMTFPSIMGYTQGQGDTEEYEQACIDAAAALTMTIGLLTLGLGLLRLGFIDSVLSRPVLAGFIISVASILMVQQLPPMFGISAGRTAWDPEASSLDRLVDALESLAHNSNQYTIVISILSVTFLLTFTFLKRRYPSNRVLTLTPEILLLVVFTTIVSYAGDFQSAGIAVLGPMPTGFKAPRLPNLNQGSATTLISSATIVTVLGFVESQLIAKTYASKFGYTVSANRELVALGLCSIFGSFFGAYTAYGSFPRTKVSVAAGGRSHVSLLVAAGVVLISILFLMPLFQYLPRCVPGAIVFCVAASLIEPEEVRFIVRVKQWRDLILLVAMIIFGFFLGIDAALFFAFACCLLLVVRQTSMPGVTMLGRGYKDDAFHDVDSMDEEEIRHLEGILIYKLDGPLYFANTEKLKDSTRRMETWGSMHAHPSEKVMPLQLTAIVFDMTSLSSVDASALASFLEIVRHYREQHHRVCLVRVKRDIRRLFDCAGILSCIGPENLFRTLEAAVKDIQAQNLGGLKAADKADNGDDRSPDIQKEKYNSGEEKKSEDDDNTSTSIARHLQQQRAGSPAPPANGMPIPLSASTVRAQLSESDPLNSPTAAAGGGGGGFLQWMFGSSGKHGSNRSGGSSPLLQNADKNV